MVEKFAKKVCQVFEIESQCLVKSKQIQRFHNKVVKFVIYVIYLLFIICL